MSRKSFVKGANPYMPLWEHVPDGEPRVFTHNGEERVYVYGSHDTERAEYCGRDYVVWSAPVTDLTDWKCHGTCYKAEDDSILFTCKGFVVNVRMRVDKLHGRVGNLSDKFTQF